MFEAACRQGPLSTLTTIRINATFTVALCRVLEMVAVPLRRALEQRLAHGEQAAETLRAQIAAL